MSDAVTNVDAEDVLDAIRRLVAETHGARPQNAASSDQNQSGDTAMSPEADALVLTPEFRVIKNDVLDEAAPDAAQDQSQAPATPQEEPSQAVEVSHDEPFVLTAAQAVSEDEPGEACDALEASEDVGETAQADALTEDHFEFSEAQTAPEDHSNEASDNSGESETLKSIEGILSEDQKHQEEAAQEDTQASWEPSLDDTPDAEAAEQAAQMSLEERIAELEAAVGTTGSTGEEWEPDGSEDLSAEVPNEMPAGFGSGASVLHFRARQEDGAQEDDVQEDEAEMTDTPEQAEAVQETDAPQAEETSFDAGVSDVENAEPEVAEGEIAEAEVIEETPADQDWSAPADDAGTEAHFAEDVEVSEVDPEPTIAEIDDDEEFGLAGYPEEEALDEEALRELVTQIIREELQGEMGERITRNVRRLVRREVQRAMTLKDFD